MRSLYKARAEEVLGEAEDPALQAELRVELGAVYLSEQSVDPAARSVPLAQEEKPPGGALQRILRRLLGDGETPPAEHKPRRFGDDGYRG